MKIAPSIIAADFTRLRSEIKKVENAGADLIHLDIMDGVFVPNITFGPMIVEAINRMTELELDAHLMIVNPENYYERFIESGADWISFHIETVADVKKSIKFLKEKKCRAGIAINPETPLKKVLKFIEELDYLLIMSVHPGFYGQKFIPEVLKKIEQAREYIDKNNYKCLVQVDGGINGDNAGRVARSGADILVAGAGVFKTRDYKKAIRSLKCSRT
ncbi:MAG: ribulose-phosphate 3-epimerase [candidate division WOR-3 bacterium]|nr:ribulose-phosphate 3-epimerase [candidate division WOR-3 bacterium]